MNLTGSTMLAKNGKPYNVLFIISDQHRYDSCGFTGHPVIRTPNLDALAAAGTRFDTAYTPCPLCLPARASILTGSWPHTNGRCGVNRGDLPLGDLATMGSTFRQAGYVTGAIGKMHVPDETRDNTNDLGFDERAMRIYTHWFEDYIKVVGEKAADTYATYRKKLPRFQTVYNPTNTPIDLPEEKMYDHLVVARCLDFMDRHADQPFFLWAGLEKPHTDWTAPAEYHAMYSEKDALVPPTCHEERLDMPEEWYLSTRQTWTFREEEIPRCIAAYYANCTYLDAKIGELLDGLDRLGIRENTIIAYTTDHGEMLFDHGMVQKQNFFEGSVHVPLIIHHPDLPAQAEARREAVNLIDLFPTFCELTGVERPESLEGQSLAGALKGETPDDRATFSEFYTWRRNERMILRGDWKYIFSEGTICQLYNLKEDPQEESNLIDREGLKEIQSALHAELLHGWETLDGDRLAQSSGAWNDREEWFEGFNAWKSKRSER